MQVTYLFNRLLHRISNDRDRAGLAHTKCSSDGLLFYGRVPLWLDNVDAIRDCKVEPLFQVSTKGTTLSNCSVGTNPTEPVWIDIRRTLISGSLRKVSKARNLCA